MSSKLVKKEDFNFEVKNEFDYSFEVDKDGVYLIEIIASAKSWWQNLFKNHRSFLEDDNLTFKLDGLEFPKFSNKKNLFNGEVSWNGNNLKGLLKTDILITGLKKGLHSLLFLAQNTPFLKSIRITETAKAPGIKEFLYYYFYYKQ